MTSEVAPPSPPVAGDRRRLDSVLEGELEQAWTRPDLRCPGPPLVDDRRVFALEGGDDRRLMALDARNGRTLWRSGPLPSKTSGPRWYSAYADGRVYVNNQQGDVHAFDARTGVRVWSRWLGSGNDFEEAAVLAVDGRVFVPNPFGLTALDGASGQTVWRHASTLTRPILADGRLYATDTVDAGTLRALSPADGAVLWSTSEGQRDFAIGRSLLAQNGRVHATKGVFDGATGRLLGPPRGYIGIDDDLGVTREPAEYDFGLLVERVADRTPVWSARHDSFSSAVVFAGHTLYGYGSRLTQFDRSTGRPTWQTVLPGDREDCPNGGALAANLGRDFLAVAAHGAVTAYREPRVTVRSATPAHGAFDGGEEVRIFGGGLSQARAIRFGTRDVPIERVVTDREVVVRAPALPAGEVSLRAVTAAGATGTQRLATYRALGTPRLARAAPTRGPAGGGTLVRLVGDGLSGVASVRFGDLPATSVVARSDRELEATAPEMPAGPATITVTSLDGRTATVPWLAEAGPSSRVSHPDRVGPDHSGVARGPLGSELTRLWRAPLVGLEGPPLLAAGKIFAVQCPTSDNCQINAYDRDTGRRVWSTGTSRLVSPGFAFGADAVFYSDSAGGTTALEAATGAVRWTRQSGGSLGGFGDDILADDRVVITRLTDAVAVDPRTGLRRWLLQPRSENLALGPRGVYAVVGIRGELRKHDRDTGTVVWTAPAAQEDAVTAPPLVTDSGIVRESGFTASLVEESTGASRPVAPTQISPRAVADGITYGLADDPAVDGHNPQLSARRMGGDLVWTKPPTTLRGAPLVADGRLYVLDSARRVLALDLRTGADVWGDDAAVDDASPFETSDDAVSAAERRLLVTTGDTATVYAQQGLTVLSVTPASAAPGETVTVTGVGLSAATDVRIGGVPVESWRTATDGLLTFALPADAAGGPQQVSISSDITASPASSNSTINVDLPPAVTSVEPDSGAVVGGQIVTVRGRGLLGAAGVQFGDVLGSDLQVVDDATLRVTTPPRALPGTVPVTVLEPVDRRSPANDAASYRYRLPPLIEEVAPAAGREGVPSTVTLTGTELDQVQTVLFGDVPATRVDAVNDQTLLVQTPPLAPGTYAVSARGAGGSGAAAPTAYVVAAAPVPAAPRDVTGTSSSSILRTSWLAPEGSAAVTGYRVVTEPRGADVTVPASTLQVDLTGLAPGTSYSVAVVPLSDLGSGVVTRSLPVKVVAEAAPSPTPSASTAPASSSPTAPASSTPSTSSSPAATTSASPSATPSAAGTTASPAASSSASPSASPSSTSPSPRPAGPTGSPSPSAAPPVAPALAGQFMPLPPARLFDTRDGTGVRQGRVQAGQPLRVDPRGRHGVPSQDVSAIVLNVTVTGASAAGYVTVFPSGASVPQASNLNYGLGQTVPNLVTATLGDDGRISLFANAGAPHLIGDIAGYYTDAPSPSGSLFTALSPARVLDTREGIGAAAGRPGPHGTVLTVAGRGGVPSSGVRAVVLNTTVTGAAASGHLTVYPAGQQRPEVSNLNYVRGQTRANLVVVPVDDQGRVVLVGSAGAPHVVADVVGYYAMRGASFRPLQPERVLDTRSGNGSAGRLSPQVPRPVEVAGRAGVPDGATAVLLNVTATGANAGGFVTVYPGGSVPVASNLNYTKGATVPNLVVVPLDGDGNAWLFSNAGSPHALADVVGYFGSS